MNGTQNNEKEYDAKPNIDRYQHNDHTLFINNNYNTHFNPDRFCWRCHSLLRLRPLKQGRYGLYCSKCSRFRRLKVPVEPRGEGLCRTDVRRSGKYHRKVMLDEKL